MARGDDKVATGNCERLAPANLISTVEAFRGDITTGEGGMTMDNQDTADHSSGVYGD